ncbi:MAG TPA: phytanoyl-CoA dioxygenase family protein [Chthonomonadaceae bacterium]|nr:phytanoyl-CoA dioxygenase family protein [Chthonomonadaceae bacterium]
MLSEQQIDFFKENGYLRIPKVFTPAEIRQMSEELDRLIQEWAITNMGWTGPWRQVYMDPDTEKKSQLTHLHDLHFYSQAWCRAVANPRLAEAMAELLGTPNVELHHTTLHLKPPETGMPFPMHQDSPFYRHEGFGYIDALVHVDDATLENGCLRFLPGSHTQGHLDHVLTMPDGSPCSPHLPTDRYRLADTVACPAEAGDVVAFSIYTVHGSEINRTDRWRRLVRIGYRDPLNRQVAGQSLGRAGLLVHGTRPLGSLQPTASGNLAEVYAGQPEREAAAASA